MCHKRSCLNGHHTRPFQLSLLKIYMSKGGNSDVPTSEDDKLTCHLPVRLHRNLPKVLCLFTYQETFCGVYPCPSPVCWVYYITCIKAGLLFFDQIRVKGDSRETVQGSILLVVIDKPHVKSLILMCMKFYGFLKSCIFRGLD